MMRIDLDNVFTQEEIDKRVSEYIENNKEVIDAEINKRIEKEINSKISKAFRSNQLWDPTIRDKKETNSNLVRINNRVNSYIANVIDETEISKENIKEKVLKQIDRAVNKIELTIVNKNK